MSKVKHVSFEELAGNLAEMLTEVRTEHKSIVVEYASGEKLLIKPYSPSRQGGRKKQLEGDGLVANNTTGQSNPNRAPDTPNISSVGAVYDLDPNSITPG